MKMRALHSLTPALLALLAVSPAQADPVPSGPSRQVTEQRRFVDGAGVEIHLGAAPVRLISMAPSVTEMLLALGMAPRLVGVSDFCALPEEMGRVSRIGGLINPDLETIVSLRPDLAVATTSGNYLEDTGRIQALGIPVYTTDTPSVESVLVTLTTLGSVLHMEERARQLVGELRSRLDTVESRVAGRERPRVLFIVWGDPLLVPGRGAFINDALSRAGAISISRDAPARWAEYGLEQAIAGAPDVILTVPDNREFMGTLKGDPRWRTVPAVRDGRIHVVSNAIQQPGPGIVDGIMEVAGLLHPERPGHLDQVDQPAAKSAGSGGGRP